VSRGYGRGGVSAAYFLPSPLFFPPFLRFRAEETRRAQKPPKKQQGHGSAFCPSFFSFLFFRGRRWLMGVIDRKSRCTTSLLFLPLFWQASGTKDQTQHSPAGPLPFSWRKDAGSFSLHPPLFLSGKKKGGEKEDHRRIFPLFFFFPFFKKSACGQREIESFSFSFFPSPSSYDRARKTVKAK